MFTVRTVKKCPVTAISQGVMTMPAQLIAQLAGAVRDDIEWIMLLEGTRSADGYEVKVEKFIVPKQRRGGADAELIEMDLPEGVVGVIHSHHRMGAFFSTIDNNTLNPRFPSSIVVAVANNTLGFNYKAEGKVTLPCGSTGIVEFQLAVAGERAAALNPEPVRGKHEMLEKPPTDLGDCDQAETKERKFTMDVKTACGIELPGRPRPLAFGIDGSNELLKEIREQTVSVIRFGPSKGNGYNGKGYTVYNGGVDTGKKRKKAGKIKAYRNGMQKLERPSTRTSSGGSEFSSSGTAYGGCERCHAQGRTLRKIGEFDDWLCVGPGGCYQAAQEILATYNEQEARALGLTGNEYQRVRDDEDFEEIVINLTETA